MENIYDPVAEGSNIKNDLDKEHIRSFVLNLEKASEDPDRKHKMREIEEDSKIERDLHALLPNSGKDPDYYSESLDVSVAPPMMKGSLYFQIKRKYDATGVNLPKMRAIKTRGQAQDFDNIVAMATLDEINRVAEFKEVYEDVYSGFNDEGTVPVQTGFDGTEIGDERTELSEWFFDPAGEKINGGNSARKGRVCKWALRRCVMNWGDFEEFLDDVGRPDLKGRVAPGDVLTRDSVNIEEEERITQMKSPVSVYYAFSTREGKERYTIFAGQSGTEIKDIAGLEKYPFKKNGRAVIPVALFHFSRERLGLYSMSMIGVIKDGAESMKKLLNRFLPNIARSINPINFLMGDTDQITIEEMKVYNAMQDMGYSPIVQTSSSDVNIKSIAPQSTFREFQEARMAIYDDLGGRLGINFRIQEDTNQRATIFIENQRDENRHLSMLNDVNKGAFEWNSEFKLDLAREFWEMSDNRKLYVSIGPEREDEIAIDFSLALETLDKWGGNFEADTSIKTPLSVQERSQSLQLVLTLLSNMFSTGGIYSIEQIKPDLDLLYEQIVLFELDHVVTRGELEGKAQAFIELNNQQSPPQQPDLGGEEGVDGQSYAQGGNAEMLAQRLPNLVQ